MNRIAISMSKALGVIAFSVALMPAASAQPACYLHQKVEFPNVVIAGRTVTCMNSYFVTNNGALVSGYSRVNFCPGSGPDCIACLRRVVVFGAPKNTYPCSKTYFNSELVYSR